MPLALYHYLFGRRGGCVFGRGGGVVVLRRSCSMCIRLNLRGGGYGLLVVLLVASSARIQSGGGDSCVVLPHASM